jgi:hypothetical protein
MMSELKIFLLSVSGLFCAWMSPSNSQISHSLWPDVTVNNTSKVKRWPTTTLGADHCGLKTKNLVLDLVHTSHPRQEEYTQSSQDTKSKI